METVPGVACRWRNRAHCLWGDTGPGADLPLGPPRCNSFLVPSAFATVAAEGSSSVGSRLEEGDVGRRGPVGEAAGPSCILQAEHVSSEQILSKLPLLSAPLERETVPSGSRNAFC